MTAEQFALIAGIARDVTVSGLLLLVIVGGARGWWVYGSLYREMQTDRNFWRDHALRIASSAEKLTAAAERAGRSPATGL